MTIKLKSNSAFGGAATLSNVAVITRTVANIYAEYAARVAALGGTVTDAAACELAIEEAHDCDYFYRASAAVSPDWGRVVSGANITRLVNLCGSIDGVMTGTVALDTATNPKDLADFGAGDTMTFTGLSVLKAGADGLAVLECSYRTAPAGDGGRVSFTPAAEAWWFDQQSPLNIWVNGVAKYTGSPDYVNASLEARAVMAEMTAQRMTGYVDGNQRKVVTPSGGFTAIAAGATANVTYTRNAGTVMVGELWFFNDVAGTTGNDALQLATANVGARY